MLRVGTSNEVAPALTRALPCVRQAELLLPVVAEVDLELAAPPRCYRAVAPRWLFEKHLARGTSRASWPGDLEVMLDGAQQHGPDAATDRGRRRHKRRRRGENTAADGGGPEQLVDLIVSAGPEDVEMWPDGARCVEELATGPFRTVMRGARVPLLDSTLEPTSRDLNAAPRESGADAREESAPAPEADGDGFLTLGADSDSESDDADGDDDARDGLGDASVALASRAPLCARDATARDLSDWLGAAACRLTSLLSAAPVDSFVRAFRLPCHDAFRLAEGAIDARRWIGMLPQRFVTKLAGQARAAARACGAPWAALTVWGFRRADSPARPTRSHDIRSLIVFAHKDECWLVRCGP